MEYNLARPWETLDQWQKELRECKTDATIVSGRQCGKTAALSLVIADEAINIPNSYTMIGAYVIEQAEHVFWKVKDYIFEKFPDQIKGRPTLHFMEFKNGAKIICKAIGDTGASTRGPTITLLVLDETAFIPDRAWIAIEPVIALAKVAGVGRTILASTGQSKKGFFYKSTLNPNIKQFKVSARDCPRYTKEYLDQKESELSPIAFAQEYLAEFLDDYNRKFTPEWIKLVCSIKKSEASQLTTTNNFLGVDVGGGVGKGETTLQGFNATNRKYIYQNLHIYSNTIAGPDIERQIETLKNKYNYNRKSIGFDSAGLGSGTFAYMMENPKLKNCIVAVDNATRPVDWEVDGQKTKLLKEYAYDLIEEMGWRGELKCFDDPAIKQSFESIQIEFKPGGVRRYWGSYSHIVEGIKNAVWVAKNKGLNILAFC